MSDRFRGELVALIPRLLRFAQALTGDGETARDLVQDTLERALGKRAQWQAGTRLDSWLYRIAQNLWIDERRRMKRRGTQVDAMEAEGLMGRDGRDDFEARMRLQRAQQALAALPDEQRLAVILVHVEGLSYQEAASVLDVSSGTIASRLARAKPRLERMMSEEAGASEELRRH